MDAPETLPTPQPGCWIDGHWGQYGVARMVELAAEYGYDVAEVIDLASRHLSTMGPSDAPELTVDEHEQLSWAADEVEEWLNDHVAPAGFHFGWDDGEFFLSADEVEPDGYACTDCTTYLANNEPPPELNEDETAAWIAELNRRTEGYTVVLACPEECQGEFSMSPCDVCGSRLGGDRHPVAFLPREVAS